MYKEEMLEQLEGKIAELETLIQTNEAEDKTTGRYRRQVRPLYVIKELLSMIDSDEITLESDFAALIEGVKSRSRYELEDGMTLAEVMQRYTNMSVAKLEKKGFSVDYAKGVIRSK